MKHSSVSKTDWAQVRKTVEKHVELSKIKCDCGSHLCPTCRPDCDEIQREVAAAEKFRTVRKEKK